MRKLKSLTRNQYGVALAFLGGLSIVAGPLLAIAAVWCADSRWFQTAVIGVVLGLLLIGLAWLVYDAEAS